MPLTPGQIVGHDEERLAVAFTMMNDGETGAPSIERQAQSVAHRDTIPIRPLVDWLDHSGYTVITKPAKEFVDASGRRRVKGDMDIELAVDAMEPAKHIDEIVNFSGAGDFRSLVEAVQRWGVRVTVVSTISTQPPMIADELRRQADVFIDLTELQPRIGRDPAGRSAPRPRIEHRGHQIKRPRRRPLNSNLRIVDHLICDEWIS